MIRITINTTNIHAFNYQVKVN